MENNIIQKKKRSQAKELQKTDKNKRLTSQSDISHFSIVAVRQALRQPSRRMLFRKDADGHPNQSLEQSIVDGQGRIEPYQNPHIRRIFQMFSAIR